MNNINLEISDERLSELYSRIKPVVCKHNILYYIKEVSLRSESFLWGPITTTTADNLEVLVNITTYHTGSPMFFKPSIAEVLAQIPEKYINECVAFEIPGDGEYDGYYHNTRTTLYKKKEGIEVKKPLMYLDKAKSVEWLPEVVFKVFCNDDLTKLPKNIVIQMRDHLDDIINDRYVSTDNIEKYKERKANFINEIMNCNKEGDDNNA